MQVGFHHIASHAIKTIYRPVGLIKKARKKIPRKNMNGIKEIAIELKKICRYGYRAIEGKVIK